MRTQITLPMQVGAWPLHSPLSWQVLVLSPTTLDGKLQLYVAVDPGVFPSTLTEPPSGSSKSGQVITTRVLGTTFIYHIHSFLRMQVGASPLHSPLVSHVLLVAPTTLKPESHEYVAMDPGVFSSRSIFTDPSSGSARSGQVISSWIN